MLARKFNSFDSDERIIALESMNHCGNNLVNNNYKDCVINSIQTSTMCRNNIRKMKTGKADTFIIAKTLMMNPHRLYFQYNISLMHLKELGRFPIKLNNKRMEAKIQLTSYVGLSFAELYYVFKSVIHQKSVYAVLKGAPTLVAIASMYMTHLSHFLETTHTEISRRILRLN